MKKVDNTINMDSELEALAKAFVKKAIEKGYNKTRIYEITTRICRECHEELFPNPVISLELESSDEVYIRNKVVKVLEENEYFNMKNFHRYVYDKDDVHIETNAILEIICAMYKVFKSDIENPTAKDVLNLAKKRLDAIDIDYPNRTEIDLGYRKVKLAFNGIRSRDAYSRGTLEEFMSQYWYKRRTISEYILIAIWVVNNQ